MHRVQSFSSLPPVIFHKYQVEKTLENGVFGEVLKAYKSDDDDDDSKKIPVTIRTFRENHKRMDELDLGEIDTISQMDHDNVVRVFDMVWNINSGGVELYLVYHYCNRGDLAVFLQDCGPLREVEVQSFVLQMSSGLSALRDHDIVHRDLKPSNILVEERAAKGEKKDGQRTFVYKIADLGLTKLFFDDQEGIAFCDYPTFVAPEVLKSKQVLPVRESKIDLWSLGFLILFCLTGEVPFNGNDLSQIGDREVDVTGQVPRGTCRELRSLIRGLIRIDVGERLSFGAFLRCPFTKSYIWFCDPYGHTLPCSSPVTSLCLDDQFILCGLESGLIEVFDRIGGFQRCQRLDFHRKTVTALAINHEIIISGSQDTTIAVWGKERFDRLQILYHHRNTVIGIEIIGKHAYSACLDGTHKAFCIDFKKLYQRKNGFVGRRYSISEHPNEEFREDLDFVDDHSGKVYPAHWRDHDHMHTVAGIIVILVYVAEDSEFRPFHILSTRAFTLVRPQLVVRMRDDGNEHFVRKIAFDSHVRQVQMEGDSLFLLHWDGQMTLFSVREVLSQRPNDELVNRVIVEKKSTAVTGSFSSSAAADSAYRAPTWFCVKGDAVAYYNNNFANVLEYKL